MNDEGIEGTRTRDSLTDDDLKALYRAARQVADIIHEYSSGDPGSVGMPWVQDLRRERPSPYFNQVVGLCLEFY